MIDEIPAYVAAANMTTNNFWNNVEREREYTENLVKQSKEDPEKYGGKTWSDDPTEIARRI